MLVSFVAATLEVIAGTGKVPTITLRSIDPIKVDGTDADTVNDGRYSVRLSPGQSDWLRDRLAAVGTSPDAESTVAFVTAIRSGSVTMPDASRGKRAAHGGGILDLLPALAEDEAENGTENGTEGANVAPVEPTPAVEPTPDTAPAPKGRQRRS